MPRARSIPAKPLSAAEQRAGARLAPLTDYQAPKSRGDCKDGPRPCVFARCRHHLYLDVNQETGSLKLNFPHLAVWEMRETCSLDVADRGGATLEEVGPLLNVTRERVRQLEVRALDNLRVAGVVLRP